MNDMTGNFHPDSSIFGEQWCAKLDAAPVQEPSICMDPNTIAMERRDTDCSSSKKKRKAGFNSIECASFVTEQRVTILTIPLLTIPSLNTLPDTVLHHLMMTHSPTIPISVYGRFDEPKHIPIPYNGPSSANAVSVRVCDFSSINHHEHPEYASAANNRELDSWHRAMEEGVLTLAAAQMISGGGEDLPVPPHRLTLVAAAAAAAAAAARYTYY